MVTPKNKKRGGKMEKNFETGIEKKKPRTFTREREMLAHVIY
jgi:hypothetical protein